MKDSFALIEDRMREMVQGEVLVAGLARIAPDGAEQAVLMGRQGPGGPSVTDPTLRMRVASVTKMATGHAIAGLAADGVLDLDAPCGLETMADLSLRELLSHTSGLTDKGGYIVEPGQDLMAFAATAPLGKRGAFQYCNLGFLCAAAGVERQMGLRFDHLLSARVFQPAGIRGGVNWVDIGPEGRAHRLPLYQRRQGGFHLCVDEEVDPDAELVWTDGRPLSLMGYRLGQDTGLFSPHGGLRCNVIELARLARLIGSERAASKAQRTPLWQIEADADGLFQAYGLGLTLYDGHPQIPGPLVGHAGSALGFQGGAWFNLETGEAWGYVLTGAPEPPDNGEEEAFYTGSELWIMAHL